MIISESASLKSFNSFGVEAFASRFVRIKESADLPELYSDRQGDLRGSLFLGSGSNLLFAGNFDGLVLKNEIGGIYFTEGAADEVQVSAGGGVLWNDLVSFCVERGFGGIENLSLIPGTVGAAPVQNIGAYGVELKDVFHSCKAFDTLEGRFSTFSKEDCRFAYRDSVFKSEMKGRYFITEVSLSLKKDSKVNLSYGAIRGELNLRGISEPSIKDVSETVSRIRTSKLPDPSQYGNAGSFFKNPIIDVKKLDAILSDFLDIVYYPYQPDLVKVAAGWLIEKAGLKGVREGFVGTWPQQALVLVNFGNATGIEVYEFSEMVINRVEDLFGIRLEREVNLIGL